MIYKLRNPGGVESWYSKTEADVLSAQEGWSVVESRDDSDAPVAAPAAPAEASAVEETAVSVPAVVEAPAAPAKKGKGR